MKEMAIGEQLKHVHDHFCNVVWYMLAIFDLLAWSLNNLRSADVPTRHYFELNDYHSIYHLLGRKSPQQMQILEEKIDKILKAGILLAIYACLVTSSSAPKKDGKPRLCHV